MSRGVGVGRRVALAALALALAACGGNAGPPPEPSADTSGTPGATASPSRTSVPPSPRATPKHTPTPSATTSAAPEGLRLDHEPLVDRVLAISVDGLNPQAILELGPEGAPAFHELGREAAGTLDARTELELTVTLPNHTGMLTGRRVDPDQGGHGVVVNDDLGGTVHDAAGEHVASVFDVVHDAGGTTALFTSKEKFAFFDRSWPVIDRYTVELDNPDLVDLVVADLADSQRTFTFLHLSAPDVVGHAHGWMSAPYLDAVREVDRLLGELLDAVDHAGPSMAVILTADHGGQGPGHGDPTLAADYTVPFFVRAPGVPGGTDLYDLNPQLRDPGTGRPAYDGPQPVRNGDLANLVTDLLGLPAVPGSTLDAAQDLQVTRR